MVKNFDLLKEAIKRTNKNKIPIYEHSVDDEIIIEIMGFEKIDKELEKISKTTKIINSENIAYHLKQWKKRIDFYRAFGYGYVPIELPLLFIQAKKLEKEDTAIYSKGKREWINEKEGFIKDIKDIDNPEYFPGNDKIYDFNLLENILNIVPDDMKVIGGIDIGPMELYTGLLGTEEAFFAFYENKELINKLNDKFLEVFNIIFKRLAEIKKIEILRIGDDLGFKSSTMISPELLKKYVFPVYKDVVEISHASKKPFILHSCGNLKNIMDDLIDYCKIDAKHSFEDVIMPVTEALKIWGSRISLLGGIDLDYLVRRTEKDIKDHTKRVMDVGSKYEGFAIV